MPSPTLYILHTSKTFDHLVVALATLPLDLVNVRACTFPGRPEPRLASWVTRSPDPTHLLLFDYIPDLHLRTLTLLAALPGELGLDGHQIGRAHV